MRIGAAGDVTAVASADIPAYSYQTEIAIFTDYLVVTGNNDWRSTTVQVYDLRQSGLSALPKLSVPGRIPSEFHVDVRDTYLRLVYGPADRSAGSTLAIYDLADNLTQVGSVGQIAPGEDLFATRFHGDYAYVVTYERVDPLWVIDVSVPSKPQIKGELKVPGWSEKLFFNDNRLFAVGIDDVPLDDGKRVRLVSSSVFDVADPLTPTLLGRFTPLREDGVTYSWSSALSDERALLLDWHDQYAMLPIETWHSTSGVYLQKISLAGDSVSEGGRLDLPVSVQRSVELQPNQFGVLGDQMFLTVDWQGTQARQLGALELAQNLRWLSAEDGQLWTAAHGRNGYYRVYRYDSADLEQAQQSWSVAKAYNYVLSDAEQLVLLNNAPLSVQVLNRDSGELSAPRLLDDSTERYFYSRPLLKDNHLYLSQYNYERYPAIVEPLPTAPTDTLDKEAVADSTTPYPYLRQWTLQDWALDNNRAPQSYTIPGEPLGLTSAGLLVTREADANGLLRLNLLALQGHYARLLDSRSFECYSHTALVWGDADNAYFTCARPYYVIQADNGIDNSNTLFKLNFAAKRIADSGEWTFDKPKNIITAYQNLVLLSDGYYYGYPYYEDTATVGIAVERMTSDALIAPMPPQENTCQVYDLSGAVALALADASQCRSGSVLTQDALYSANGFAGLSKDAAF